MFSNFFGFELTIVLTKNHIHFLLKGETYFLQIFGSHGHF